MRRVVELHYNPDKFAISNTMSELNMRKSILNSIYIVITLICFSILGAFSGCAIGVMQGGQIAMKFETWIKLGVGLGILVAIIWMFRRYRAGKDLWHE
ncbi:MAG: hypothetical protein ABJA67_09350 [Chthonomonadales bacterium]